MYTWNNVQYANSAGILNNMTANDKAAAEGRQQIVDSISGFGEDYSKLQTDEFNAAVNTAGSTEEVNQLMSNRNSDWLNMTDVNANVKDRNKEFRDVKEFDAGLELKRASIKAQNAQIANQTQNILIAARNQQFKEAQMPYDLAIKSAQINNSRAQTTNT